jgi:hypothetical protein
MAAHFYPGRCSAAGSLTLFGSSRSRSRSLVGYSSSSKKVLVNLLELDGPFQPHANAVFDHQFSEPLPINQNDALR